ncbi:MAG TPA: TIGR01841 family phasin [Paraburkholderia sp.]|uniref:TIGR01841 family phasin n=1 Tax=Paraburkholderia sp. TaxID=1926495 RepID=UPI002B45DA64|nr:TIGR01841 family phasin [Paraburkholderia sp.]HKR41542.1 TIGR01841 family phasin [Paraburkholderia sp.]
MSASIPEQLMTSHKANISTLFSLTGQMFDGYSRLVELNLATARAAGTESLKLCKEILSSTTPEELLARQAGRLQPEAEQVLSYASHLCDILRDTQSKWMLAAQAQYDAKNRNDSQS